MKPKYLNLLCAVGLSFLVSFGSLGSMVTALDLGDRLALVAVLCLIAAIVTAVCFMLRWRRRLLPLLWLSWLPVIFLPGSPFLGQCQDLFRQMMTIYGKAYTLPLPPFLQEATAQSHFLPLLLLAALISLGVCWAVQRQCSPILAYFSGSMPVAACIVVTDTVPNLIVLLVWLSGLILLGLTHKVRLRNRNQGDRLTLYCAIPVALGLYLLTLLVPQKSYCPPLNLNFQQISQWFTDRFGTVEYVEVPGDSGQINLSNRVDLSAAHGQPNSKDVIMKLESAFSGTVYLKGRDYDTYGGMEWTSDPNRQESAAFPGYRWLSHQGQLKVTTAQIFNQQFVPYYTDTGYLSLGGSVENTDNSNFFSYSCYALRSDWVERWLANYAHAQPEIDPRYLALPEETSRAAWQILQQIPIPADSDPVTQSLCIEQYVKNSAAYDLTPQRFPAGTEDFAIWFLQNAESGYCVHFATSATVLLRAAGIPARYVEGYMAKVYDGKTTAVQGKMAHAWVEYFVSGVGWVVLDPTPSDDTEPPQPTDPTTEPTTRPTAPTTEPPEPSTEPTEPSIEEPSAPGPSVTEPTTLPTRPIATTPALQAEPKAAMPVWVLAVLIGLLAVTLTGLGMEAQWYLRRRRRLKRMGHGPSKARALALYRESQRLCRHLNQALPPMLQQLAEKACFSQYELTEQELEQFNDFLRQGIDQLKKRSFPRRLIYRLVYALY